MTFDQAFAELIGNEGGYSCNAKDSGGETMWGITKRVAVANGYTDEMKALPLERAKAIAKAQYWDRFHCGELPDEIDFQVFDTAYNGGYPAKWLQQAAKVNVDGVLGPQTIAAVNAADPEKVIMRFDAYRLQWMAGLSTWSTFGRGWANRIANNLIAATEP